MKKLLLPLLFWQLSATAQTGLWLDAGVQKNWNKKLTSEFNLGNRRNLGKGFDRLFLDMSHQYEIYDGIQLEGAYRFVSNEKGNQFVLQRDLLVHRFQLGFKIDVLDLLDVGPKRLSLSWSSTQQWSFQLNQTTSSIWRNKLSLGYDVKNFPLSPCMSAEHFYRWNASVVYTPTDVIVSGATTQWRYFFGAAIELPEHHDLKLQVGFRIRANGTQPLTRISYCYQF
jgi:hypothetical protein